MTTKWRRFAIVVVCLAPMAGCRTPQPALTPGKSAEQLVEPPTAGRYDKPGFPPEAMDRTGERSTLGDARSMLGDAPRSLVPTSGIGSLSNNGTGPYKF
jgi:hypothetical protein